MILLPCTFFHVSLDTIIFQLYEVFADGKVRNRLDKRALYIKGKGVASRLNHGVLFVDKEQK